MFDIVFGVGKLKEVKQLRGINLRKPHFLHPIRVWFPVFVKRSTIPIIQSKQSEQNAYNKTSRYK